ncbi:hypothetical protein B0H13DRAFT_94323 [Mycena leptocephala]|nr:hypothetical protein B0H13DRAFT_94323 [Mycena leptocephala]
MNDSEELFANGPPSMPKNARRLSDPGGRPSERRPKVLSRRQSDPGRGFSVFALRDTLRPVTQLSMNSRSDGGRRLSYAETSSATQSFVSFDTGNMDTPTHSAVALSTSSDAEPDVRNPYDHRTTYDPTRRASPARSNTARAPQVVGQRLDPRRAATQLPDPRQASAQRPDPRQASPQRLDPRQASPQRLDPRQVSPQRLDPRQASPKVSLPDRRPTAITVPTDSLYTHLILKIPGNSTSILCRHGTRVGCRGPNSPSRRSCSSAPGHPRSAELQPTPRRPRRGH